MRAGWSRQPRAALREQHATQDRDRALATAGTVHRDGCQIIGTDIEDEEELIPHPGRHVDVVVRPYPEALVVYDQTVPGRAARLAKR